MSDSHVQTTSAIMYNHHFHFTSSHCSYTIDPDAARAEHLHEPGAGRAFRSGARTATAETSSTLSSAERAAQRGLFRAEDAVERGLDHAETTAERLKREAREGARYAEGRVESAGERMKREARDKIRAAEEGVARVRDDAAQAGRVVRGEAREAEERTTGFFGRLFGHTHPPSSPGAQAREPALYDEALVDTKSLKLKARADDEAARASSSQAKAQQVAAEAAAAEAAVALLKKKEEQVR